MAFTIALSGKGGSGKTTIAALIVRWLLEEEQGAVLAVDADPNSTLGHALGVNVSSTVADIREDVVKKRVSLSAGMSKDRAVEYLVEQSVVEAKGFDVLVMGRPEGPDCYCYVNHILRSYLDRVGKHYRFVVIDNEAGMEHLSRRTTNNVEVLLLVADATLVSLRAAERISALAETLPIKVGRKLLVVNRAPSPLPEPVGKAAPRLGLPLFATVPYDRQLEEIFASEKPLFLLPDSSAAYAEISLGMASLLKGKALSVESHESRVESKDQE